MATANRERISACSSAQSFGHFSQKSRWTWSFTTKVGGCMNALLEPVNYATYWWRRWVKMLWCSTFSRFHWETNSLLTALSRYCRELSIFPVRYQRATSTDGRVILADVGTIKLIFRARINIICTEHNRASLFLHYTVYHLRILNSINWHKFDIETRTATLCCPPKMSSRQNQTCYESWFESKACIRSVFLLCKRESILDSDKDVGWQDNKK